jgi:hypothetical protein
MGSFVSPEEQLPYPYLQFSAEELKYEQIADITF